MQQRPPISTRTDTRLPYTARIPSSAGHAARLQSVFVDLWPETGFDEPPRAGSPQPRQQIRIRITAMQESQGERFQLNNRALDRDVAARSKKRANRSDAHEGMLHGRNFEVVGIDATIDT